MIINHCQADCLQKKETKKIMNLFQTLISKMPGTRKRSSVYHPSKLIIKS